MSAAWPTVMLGEVLNLSDRAVPSAALSEINLAGVYSFGRGLFKRGPMKPAETSYKSYNRLVRDDFVISQPKAWEGALARVTCDFEGWFLSPVFPTFSADTNHLLPAYLEWFCKRESVWQDLQVKSKGIGARRETVSSEQFLSLEIPLPPLNEQRRIVARIEELAARVEEAKALNESSLEAGRRLLSAMAHRADLTIDQKLDEGWQRAKLRDILTEYGDPCTVHADATYPNFGIFSFGRGLFAKPPINGLETSAIRLFRARAGLFIYSRLFAFEGAYGVVEEEYDGYFVSNEYPMFVCDDSRVLPEFLAAYVLPSTVWRQIAEGSGGLGDRRQRVQPEHFLKHEVLLPPLEWQRKIKVVRNRLAEAAALQVEMTTELNALLPAILDRAFKNEL